MNKSLPDLSNLTVVKRTLKVKENTTLYCKCELFFRWCGLLVFSKSRKKRTERVRDWYGLRLKQEFFSQNPEAIWILEWRKTLGKLEVDFLQAIKSPKN